MKKLMNSFTKFYTNLKLTSLYLLIPTSIGFVLSGLLYINQISTKNTWLLNKALDTPTFLFFSLYVVSYIRLSQLQKMKQTPKKIHDLIILSSVIILNICLIIFDIIFTNSIPS